MNWRKCESVEKQKPSFILSHSSALKEEKNGTMAATTLSPFQQTAECVHVFFWLRRQKRALDLSLQQSRYRTEGLERAHKGALLRCGRNPDDGTKKQCSPLLSLSLPVSLSRFSPFSLKKHRRASQVEELLRLHPTTETLNRDATLFQLPLKLPGGIPSALRIALPASFPAAPPTLSLTNLSSSSGSSNPSSSSSLRHTWVDSTSGLVSCPSVLSWGSGSTSRLAQAVSEALEALREGGSSDPNRGQRGGAAVAAGPPSTSAPGAAAAFFPPPRGGSFDELESASEDQLLSWLSDGEAFAGLARRVAARVRGETAAAEATAAEASAAAATAATPRRPSKGTPGEAPPDPPLPLLQPPEAAAAALTARLASDTLAREQELREASNQVAVVRATELAPAAAEASRLRARARVVAAAISPRALVEALRKGATRADADSTRCYDAFLATGGERGAAPAAAAAAGAADQRALDTFLEEYVRLRSKYHERELKQQAAEQTLL